MKVLQVNVVYKKGSTGKIVFDIHQHLQARDIESVVCYGRGDKLQEPHVYKTCGEVYAKVNKVASHFSGIMYGGCILSTAALIRTIKKENPDIVHLHCLNGNFVNIYHLIQWLKENQFKTVLTLHAEFMHTANCVYALDCNRWKTGCGSCPRLRQETGSLFFDKTARSWQLMKTAFDGFDENLTVVSVSPWLRNRALESPILADKHHKVVLNGLDTDIFTVYDSAELRKKHHLTNEKIVFHATPKFDADPDNIKGGCYIIELAKNLLAYNVKIIVAGNYPKGLVVPENVILLGRISNQKLLAQYYSMADLTVLTSKKETFSMVVAESLCCGTPVVGFKAGAPEQISIPEYSDFVEFGSLRDLQSKVLAWLEKDCNKRQIEKASAQKYSRRLMVQQYMNLYDSLM